MSERPPAGDDSAQAWPQDDVRAREVLLAWLEDRMPLDEAVRAYVSCFPPVAKMDEGKVRRSWAGWTKAHRGMLAAQIRRSMNRRDG